MTADGCKVIICLFFLGKGKNTEGGRDDPRAIIGGMESLFKGFVRSEDDLSTDITLETYLSGSSLLNLKCPAECGDSLPPTGVPATANS